MSQSELPQKSLSKNLVLVVISIAAILAFSLHPAAPLREFISRHPTLESYHIDDLVLSFILALILLMLISINRIKRAYISERELAKYRALHQNLLENMPVAVAEFDAEQQLRISNHAFQQFSRRMTDTAGKVLMQKLSDQLAVAKGASSVSLKQHYPASESLDRLWVEWSFLRRPDNSYLLLGRDISQQEEVKEKLSVSHRILESTPIGVMVVDTNFNIEYVNRSFEQTTGYSSTEALGQNPSILQSGKHDSNFFKSLYANIKRNGYWQGEIWNRKKNGDIYPEWLSITALTDGYGVISHYIGMFSEITAQQHVRERLRTLAYYDSLTSLANRSLYNDKLEQLIKNNSDKCLCVIFIDLDEFKRINDSFGHLVGDRLLVAFAKRLQRNIRSADVIARWGGDEFIVAIRVSDASYGIAKFCEKQMAMLTQPFVIDGRDWNITASIGVSVLGEYANSAHDLIRNADLAVNQAKRRGKNRYEIFSPDLHKQVSERIEIESRLRAAIQNDQLEVYFQPQVQTGNPKIYGLEALARWKDKELGNVAPQQFIHVAEDTGIINELSNLIFCKALKQFRQWGEKDPELILSLNLSASQLQGEYFIQSLVSLVESYSVNPHQIKLEITEDVFMSDLKRSINTIAELKKAAFRISLDDFGTGYCSLSYLKDFDIDELKIDRSFINNINSSERNRAIVASIVAMAQILEIDCIVEGVENKEQLNELQHIGCSIFQGYLFHKPMPANEIARLL